MRRRASPPNCVLSRDIVHTFVWSWFTLGLVVGSRGEGTWQFARLFGEHPDVESADEHEHAGPGMALAEADVARRVGLLGQPVLQCLGQPAHLPQVVGWDGREWPSRMPKASASRSCRCRTCAPASGERSWRS